MARLLRILAIASYACLAATDNPISPYPDVRAARQNAFALFNSVHSAMRQWGSSVHHNGMSFYLARAPEGSTFYHGGYSTDRPESFEWLAFEFEHAGSFAKSREPRHPSVPVTVENPTSAESLAEVLRRHQTSHHLPLSDVSDEYDTFLDVTPLQRPVSTVEEDDPSEDPPKRPPPFRRPMRGYYQFYRTNRPLNLLYIDGQAAAKCPLGSLDSQDLILLDHDMTPNSSGEWQRALDLCALAEEWKFPSGGKIDGFVRMEAGFEIIQCDFSTAGGLDLVSVQASPFMNETGVQEDFPFELVLEWIRAVAARYHGHPPGRLEVDWSSMVSAFAYPVNLSNPDPNRQDLPRVINSTREERHSIRDRLRQVVTQRGGKDVAEKGTINWQAVADKIVTRFSERLWYMANGQLTDNTLLSTIGTVIDPFISYTDHMPMAERGAVDRCTQHYLDPTLLRPEMWTPEDHAIAAAFESVSHSICDALFSARNFLRSNRTAESDVEQPVGQARAIIRQLVEELRWSTWKECGRCPSLDEICVIPMFPFGSADDYFSPSCKNVTRVIDSQNYWGTTLE